MPNSNKKHNELLYLFFIGAMSIFFIASMIYVFSSHLGISSFLMFVDHDDTFMDFFNPIYHSYTRDPFIAYDRIYPAICYLLYYLISRFINLDNVTEISGKGFRLNQDARIVFLLISVLTIAVLTLSIVKYMNKCNIAIDGKAYLFIFLIYFSAPFLYQWERANIIVWPLILLMFYLTYMDDENKVLRELSLVALALAASIKIYPAIFGLMLLKDKRIKDAIHTAFYGVVLFILPFGVMGGFPKIIMMLKALFAGSNTTVLVTGLGYKVNFANTFAMFSSIKNGELVLEAFSKGQKITYLICLICFVCACLTKSKWKCYALMSIIMIGFPGFSFIYCMIFMIIPLIAMFSEEKEANKNQQILNYIYIALFVMALGVFAFKDFGFLTAIPGLYPVKLTYFYESIALCLMAAVLCCDVGVNFILEKKNKK